MNIIAPLFVAAGALLALMLSAQVGMDIYEQFKMVEHLEYQAKHCEPMG